VNGQIISRYGFFVLLDVGVYIIKSIQAVIVLYLKLIHIDCIACGLHRVAKDYRNKSKNVYLLISIQKSIFISTISNTYL